MAVIKGNLADGKPMQVGGWYNGQQWNGSSLGAAGVENVGANAGKAVSNQVIAQTNPANVNYVQANQIQAPVSVPTTTGASQQFVSGLSGDVDAARKALDETLKQQKAANDVKYAEYQKKEQEALKQVGTLTTPFREDLENAERERLHINENFEANQGLVRELEQLLTEGNEYIRQQQSVTGLAAIRNPRIQKAMSDIAARTGVIEAVMNARNGQIAQAQNMIDRTINAIAADRQDQISYYESIISLNRQDMLSLDDDNKRLAGEQLNVLKVDLSRAQETADYVKKLMINPDTAYLMAQGGVTLNDNIQTINTKLANAQYHQEVVELSNKMSTSGYTAVYSTKGIPQDQLVTVTDSRGNKYTYRKMPSGSGSGSSFDSKAFISQLTTSGYKVDDGTTKTKPISQVEYQTILGRVNEAVTPNVSPKAGIGSVYYDALGRKWVYEKTGWRLAQ